MKRILSLILAAILMIVATPLNSTAAAINPALASYYRGDTDGDWSVTTADARMLLAASLLNTDLTAYPQYDINGDGALTSADARDVLIETVTEVPPTLISPTVTQVDILPEGEEIAFTEAINQQFSEPYDNASYLLSEGQYVIQSREELMALYNADITQEIDYVSPYTSEFFEKNALVILKIFLRELPISINTEGIIRSGDTLVIHTREAYYASVTTAIYRSRIVIEIPQDALDSITDIQLYAEIDRPSWI